MMDVGGGPRAATAGEAGSVARRTAIASPSTTLPADAPADAAQLADLVRGAADAGAALRLVGAGRWLEAGRPVRAVRRLDLRALSGIVEYVPGDLTMTARAGTTLAELQAATRAEGQFVPLDPWGDDSGTLGATLATATAGPLAAAFGLPRDIVLGVTVVGGSGELIRAGGRVVKNVAGFDLVRLMVGAWGTLGVITEATVRLRALPEDEETFAIPIPGDLAPVAGREEALRTWLARLRAAPVQPLAAELVHPALARTLGLEAGHDGGALLVRIAGNAESMAAQRAALAALGAVSPVSADCWPRLRGADRAGGATLRLSAPTAGLAACWRAAHDLVTRANEAALAEGDVAHAVPITAGAATSAATVHGRAFASASVTRGVVRVCLPPLSDRGLRALLGDRPPAGMTRLFERLPAALWPLLAPSAVADELSRGVRRAFDPRAILNPGILGAEQDASQPASRPAADARAGLTGTGHGRRQS